MERLLPPLLAAATHTLHDAFSRKQLGGLSCEAVAKSVRHLVRHGHARELYEEYVLPQLKQFAMRCTESLQRFSTVVAPMSSTNSEQAEVDETEQHQHQLHYHHESQVVLHSVVRLWEATTVSLNLLSAVFSDLSLAHNTQFTTDRTLRYAGEAVVRGFKNQGILRRCYEGLLLVDDERNGNVVDRVVLQCVRRR